MIKKDSDIVAVCYNNHFYHKECINIWLESSNIVEKNVQSVVKT